MLRGKVREAGSLAPLYLAHVAALDADGKLLAGAVAGLGGEYQLDIAPGSAFILRVSYVGYETASIAVEPGVQWLDVDMERGAVDLPEAEVFGEAPGSGSAGLLVAGLLLMALLGSED